MKLKGAGMSAVYQANMLAGISYQMTHSDGIGMRK